MNYANRRQSQTSITVKGGGRGRPPHMVSG